MLDLSQFLIAILGAVLIGGIFTAVLHRPLGRMLAETCATEARSRFWATYLESLFMLAPIVSVAAFAAFSGPQIEVWRFVIWSSLFATAGVLAALLIAGSRIARVLGGVASRDRATSVLPTQENPEPAVVA